VSALAGDPRSRAAERAGGAEKGRLGLVLLQSSVKIDLVHRVGRQPRVYLFTPGQRSSDVWRELPNGLMELPTVWGVLEQLDFNAIQLVLVRAPVRECELRDDLAIVNDCSDGCKVDDAQSGMNAHMGGSVRPCAGPGEGLCGQTR